MHPHAPPNPRSWQCLAFFVSDLSTVDVHALWTSSLIFDYFSYFPRAEHTEKMRPLEIVLFCLVQCVPASRRHMREASM